MDDKGDKDQICIQSSKDDEEEEEWSVSCSDDEKYNVNPTNKSKILWEPKPEEIVQLYKTLNEKGILDLEWKCPGRRSPSPLPKSGENCRDDSEDELRDDEQKKTSEPNEFDFDDESTTTTTTIKPRRLLGNAKLRGSGQKRTASLKNVVSEIFRHRKLENMNQKPNNS